MQLRLLLGVTIAMCATIPAQADWLPGDGHKMHYPQLPDVNGWDVDVTTDQVLDDWQCSQTGPVSDVHLIPANGDPQPMAGWKTSQDHFMDDAVYWDEDLLNPESGLLGDWAELFDPVSGESLDMAFVITPEPGSAMLALLGAGLCLLRRKLR